MGSHMAVSVQRLLSLQVLQGEEQTAVSWGQSEGDGLGEGDPSAGGEVGPEQLLPERGIWLSS